MALTNAEKQERWRDKRNPLAKLAERLQKDGSYVTTKNPIRPQGPYCGA